MRETEISPFYGAAIILVLKIKEATALFWGEGVMGVGKWLLPSHLMGSLTGEQ